MTVVSHYMIEIIYHVHNHKNRNEVIYEKEVKGLSIGLGVENYFYLKVIEKKYTKWIN